MMRSGQRFLLKTPTVGVEKTADTEVAVRIPAGATIEITATPTPIDPMVNVQWEDRALLMFQQDVQARGEAVSNGRRLAQATSSSNSTASC